MPDDIFRIVVAVAVALAAMAFLVQAGVILALYQSVRRLQAKVEPLVERAEPVIGKAGTIVDKFGPVIDGVVPLIGKIGATVDKVGPILSRTSQIMDDASPRIAEISRETAEIARSARVQVERVGELLHDAGDRARERLDQIDQSVGSTVEQVGQVGGAVKRAVMKPVREVNGLAAGLSAAVATIVHGSRKSSVDSATQDEEMFI